MKTLKDDYFLIMIYNIQNNFYDLILMLLHNLINSIRNLFYLIYHQIYYYDKFFVPLLIFLWDMN